MAIRRLAALLALIVAGFGLAACQGDTSIPKDERPVSFALTSRMDQLQMKDTSLGKVALSVDSVGGR